MLKSIVLQQKEERNMLLKHDYQNRVSMQENEDFLASGLIKLITGPRRAGKSVFALQMLQDQNFAYLNFDDDFLLKNFDESLLWQHLLEVYPNFQYLLLDEIQNLSNWDIWVGKLYRRGVNLVITGSNANLLSNEMASVLTGRYLQINILPFGLREFIDYKKTKITVATPTEKAALLQQTDEFLLYGGFPEIILSKNIARNYLSSLFDSVLLKDITKRYKVRNTNELYNLANYLLANFCNPFSINDLVTELDLGSVHTAKKFCKYLEEPYLFFYLSRYNSKLKLMQNALKKAYVVDNGFITARAFELSKNLGRLLENLVFVELIRRGFSTQNTLFYYRTRNDKEIDFVCRQAHQVTALIQVSYEVFNPKTLKREISALTEAAGELRCNHLLLLTWDEENTITENNLKITIMPVWKWLLKLKE
ncbi:ATP-binding protein [Bacteroidia bacterium]|nr:ATP-binding protein [Bacteroidia bacterium]GHV70276.1 ATP-binding protein [Bacteroidia bacterium]